MHPFQNIIQYLMPCSRQARPVRIPLNRTELRSREALQALILSYISTSGSPENMASILHLPISLIRSAVVLRRSTPSFRVQAIFQLSRFNLSRKHCFNVVKASTNFWTASSVFTVKELCSVRTRNMSKRCVAEKLLKIYSPMKPRSP